MEIASENVAAKYSFLYFSASGPASVDQILAKYIQALGGTQNVSNLTSFAGKGTYEGFDTGYEKVPVDIFAKAPDQRATVVSKAVTFKKKATRPPA